MKIFFSAGRFRDIQYKSRSGSSQARFTGGFSFFITDSLVTKGVIISLERLNWGKIVRLSVGYMSSKLLSQNFRYQENCKI